MGLRTLLGQAMLTLPNYPDPSHCEPRVPGQRSPSIPEPSCKFWALQPLYSDICCALLPNAAAREMPSPEGEILERDTLVPLPKLGVN